MFYIYLNSQLDKYSLTLDLCILISIGGSDENIFTPFLIELQLVLILFTI